MSQDETTSSMPDSPSWKLYENPHYTNRTLKPPQKHTPYTCISNSRPSYKTHTIASFSTAANSGPDLSLSDLDTALAEIKELRAELEFERRIRKKMESLNKVLTKDVAEEKKARAVAERCCEKLGMEIKSVREEFENAVKEAEDERRMMRMADAMREERLQMKLSDARVLMEEMTPVKIENPHVKRGIKGMEFPKLGRGRNGNLVGDSTTLVREGKGSSGSLGLNLECQRAQLRVLMRHKNGGVGCNGNLVM